jgi:hypothetical protein
MDPGSFPGGVCHLFAVGASPVSDCCQSLSQLQGVVSPAGPLEHGNEIIDARPSASAAVVTAGSGSRRIRRQHRLRRG